MLPIYVQSLRCVALCKNAKRLQYLNLKTFGFRPNVGRSNIKCTFNRTQAYLMTAFRSYATTAASSAKTKVKKMPVNELQRLMVLAKPERWRMAGAVLLLLLSSGVTMAVPFCIGKVIDMIYSSAQAEKHHEHLGYMCVVFAFIFFCGALANFGRVYFIQSSGQRIVHRLRTQLFGSILKQETSFFDLRTTGELVNRLASDTVVVGNSLTQNASDGLRASVAVVACGSMMVYMSPKLALVGLCIVPPVAALAIVYGRYIRRLTRSVQDNLAEATQIAEERIANIRTVRAFVQEKNEESLYVTQLLAVLMRQHKEAVARALFYGTAGFSGNLMVLTVLYYGGSMMADNQITIGELSAFLMYAAYLGISLGGLSAFYTELMKGIGASSKLWPIIDRVPSIPTAGLRPDIPPKGRIELKDVTFSYPSRPQSKVFRNLSMTVPEGTVTAIVGNSGTGKSTVGALLLRYYDPQAGMICLDGTDIKLLDADWLRSNIGLVSQEPILFSGSVRSNILYGTEKPCAAAKKKMVLAAKEANAYNFIRNFPDQFDSLVGERGILLSGGQKQRIAIARALYKNPRILLLDEATSALDVETEHLVQEALDRLMAGRTVIIIAHRLSTIRHAHQIVVLNHGKAAETGTYNELMSVENGHFRKLVEYQTFTSA